MRLADDSSAKAWLWCVSCYDKTKCGSELRWWCLVIVIRRKTISKVLILETIKHNEESCRVGDMGESG
jgi:hypothetical protein